MCFWEALFFIFQKFRQGHFVDLLFVFRPSRAKPMAVSRIDLETLVTITLFAPWHAFEPAFPCRAMTDRAVVTITDEIIDRKLPIAFDPPFMGSRKKFDTAFPSNEFADFHKGVLKGVASGLGVSYTSLANDLEAAGVPILGTPPDAIDRAEDRERFQNMIESLGLRQPPNKTVRDVESGVTAASEIGYPLVVRPSYVLGGRAMEIVHNERELRTYMAQAVRVSDESPVLLDLFLDQAIEVVGVVNEYDYFPFEHSIVGLKTD